MKLRTLPDTATIIAFRGRVDFYLWKGIPVGRAWPRKSTQPRQPGEIASSQKFAAYVRMSGACDETVRAAFKNMTKGVGVTWVDAFRAMAGGNPWVRLG